MNIIKIFKIRSENKRKEDYIRQSKRKKCCESCSYCFLSDIISGYSIYSCFLKETGFKRTEMDIYNHKCDKYKPCRKYKKHLKIKGLL